MIKEFVYEQSSLVPQSINNIDGTWYTDKQMQQFIYNNQIVIFAAQQVFRCHVYSTQSLNNFLKSKNNDDYVGIRIKHGNRIYWKADDALLIKLLTDWGYSMR